MSNTPNFDSIVDRVMKFENPEAIALLLVAMIAPDEAERENSNE